MDWSFETGVRTLWQEARSEPPIGQQAVSHVLWNRVRDGRWGKTMGAVCLSHLQFSGWRSVDPNFQPSCAVPDLDPLLTKLRAVLLAAETEPDITQGAMWYYAASMLRPPPWVQGATSCGKFGNQFFFKDVH
jgi:N-acetylmuramoyl-L-alanine amidase